MFVFNEGLILLESKWPVNSRIYYIKKLKPSVSNSSESQEIAIREHCGILVMFLLS